jgi:hypothetical protein
VSFGRIVSPLNLKLRFRHLLLHGMPPTVYTTTFSTLFTFSTFFYEKRMLVFRLKQKNLTMNHPNEVFYYNNNCLFLVNKAGKLRKLYVPFQVKCILPTGKLTQGTNVYVEQVGAHRELLIIYRIFEEWYPYYCFVIIIYY